MATIFIRLLAGDDKVEPQRRPRYTLDELLAHCDPKAPRRTDDRQWLNDTPQGGELI